MERRRGKEKKNRGKSKIRKKMQRDKEREEERKEEKLETVRRILVGAMVLERILNLYVDNFQDAVWDVWDCPDFLNDLSWSC